MNKNFKSILFSGLIMASMSAWAGEVDFTYAQGELYAYGQGQKENIDVAMLIDNATLTGKQIKAIKAYITTCQGIENTSIWLSKALTLENKVNVPDIASYPVTPTVANLGENEFGMLYYEFDEPYIIQEGPLYIGYSMTVTETAIDEQKYPIILSEGVNEDGLFLHMSKSVLKWMNYNSKSNGVAYIVVTLEGDFSDYSLAVRDAETSYVMVNEDFAVEFQMSNNGNYRVNSLKYSYTVDDSEEVFYGEAELPAPLEPDITLLWPVTLNFNAIEEIGPHTLNLTVTEVNGEPNESEYASMSFLVNVMPFKPVHRPLVEEYTGLWCGWCPRGFVAMELLSEKYGDNIVPICYHNRDQMAVTSVYPVNVSGYPASSINRMNLIDPYYGTYNEDVDFGIYYDVEKSANELTLADIEVEAYVEGYDVEIESKTTFMVDINEANYQVGYVLVCNQLSNPNWVQLNYYAGLEEEYPDSYLLDMCRESGRITGLVFNDVAVNVDAMMGVENSLPQTIKTAETYTHNYTLNFWGNQLVQKKENLVVCAVLIDKTTGFVVNANKCSMSSVGVESIESAPTLVSTEYYDLTGRRILHPSKGIVIRKDKLSDGSVKTSKIQIAE